MNLIVSEVFKSLQGEGPKIGTPSLFVRLGGCNLRCEFCDTKYASFEEYSEEWKSYTIDELVSITHSLRGRVSNLVITGGEPLLQQKVLKLFLGKVQSFFSSMEIETNGTLVPEELIEVYGINFNVSVKLSNSGLDYAIRINEEAIEIFANLENAYFKFVVKSREDFEEVKELAEKFYISTQKIFVMPLSSSLKDLESVAKEIAELSIEFGFRYSDRLHLRLYGGERGK